MHWLIEFGGDPQDATVTTTGDATPEGFARMNMELVEDERFTPRMLLLVDHTDLVVDELTSEDVRAIASDVVGHQDALRSAAVAIVAPEPLQFGLARMSAILAEPAVPPIRVFPSRSAALDWLRQVRDFGSDPEG